MAEGRMTQKRIEEDPIMRFLSWDHLPEGAYREVSQRFGALACWVQDEFPRTAERTEVLRKLFEAKNSAVCCKVAQIDP
jgi:hypothetical protein